MFRTFSSAWSVGSADSKTTSPASTKGGSPRRRPPPRYAPPLGAPPRFAEESFRAVGAASRELPERAAPVVPPRALDGADFLLEPGSTLPRPRVAEPGDAAPAKSAINAHIAAARRAAQAALAEDAAKPAAAVEEKSENRIAAIGGQAIAFVAARRRPFLLGLALAAAVAMLAVIELRAGHVPLLQKSELSPPAARRRRRADAESFVDRSRHDADRLDFPVEFARQAAARRSHGGDSRRSVAAAA